MNLQDYNIYFFWDQVTGNEIPGLLKLCIKTWEKNGKAKNILHVNSDNIKNYSNGIIKKKDLEYFTAAQRSDAAMALTMATNRGIFLDVDTILLNNFNPRYFLTKNRPSMYYANYGAIDKTVLLAFLAMPLTDSNEIILRWSQQVTNRIKHEIYSPFKILRRSLRELNGKTIHTPWDCLGSKILAPLINDERLENQINLLDAITSGFLPLSDTKNYGPEIVNRYWLENYEEEKPFIIDTSQDGIVALQNSWLPSTFRNLTQEEILTSQTRLGNLLSSVLLNH